MEKSLKKSFIHYVSRNILGMAALSCYILADTFFIARALGANGLTSLNLSISIFSFMLALGLMLGIGGASRYSILNAQGKIKQADIGFASIVKFGLVVSIFLVSFGLFGAEQIARGLGADRDTLEMTQTYLRTILTFSPLFILNNIMIAFVRNDENPGLSMAAMLAGSFLNIVLDYFFLFPLKMGIFGATLATSIAPFFSLMILFYHFLSGKKSLSFLKEKFTWGYVPDACGLGMSAFVAEVSSGVVLITFNFVMLKLAGNMGVAAYSIVANIALVTISLFTGIGQGIQPLISHFYGLREVENMLRVRKYAFYTALGISLLAYGISFAFTDPIVSLFNEQGIESIQETARNGIRIYFLGFFFAGSNICITMYLSASESPRSAFLLSVCRGLIFLVPLVVLFGEILGTKGVWLSFVVTEALVFLLGIYVLHVVDKKYKTKNLPT